MNALGGNMGLGAGNLPFNQLANSSASNSSGTFNSEWNTLCTYSLKLHASNIVHNTSATNQQSTCLCFSSDLYSFTLPTLLNVLIIFAARNLNLYFVKLYHSKFFFAKLNGYVSMQSMELCTK